MGHTDDRFVIGMATMPMPLLPRGGGEGLYIYQCTFCWFFHIDERNVPHIFDGADKSV